MRVFTAIALAALFSVSVASASDIEGESRRFCAAQWPNDFAMQSECMTQQVTSALAWLDKTAPFAEQSDEMRASLECLTKWTGDDGLTNFHMTLFCTDQQLKALRSLTR